MNKIKIKDDDLKEVNISNNIKVEYYKKEFELGINEIKILIEKSSILEIEINLEKDTKLSINITVMKDVKTDLNIITKGNSGKVKYSYNIFENAQLNINKFQNVNSIKEMISIKLKGEKSKIDYNLKTIGNGKETYDYNILHDAKYTISNIKNNGVCVKEGTIIYQVSSFVPKNVIGCIVNQNNRIINLTNNKCEIMPNLYIDTEDVSASHSALIGKFSDDEMFYVQSRGLDYKTSLKLLVSGFLTSDICDKKMIKEINNNIEKYWR